MDDSFTIQKERTKAILDGLIERNYPFALKVRSRVDAIDRELLFKMKKCSIAKTSLTNERDGYQLKSII
jgi:hypothetical protein